MAIAHADHSMASVRRVSDAGILHRSPAVLECRHGDLLTLLSLHTGRYHTLNSLTAFIWEQLAQPAHPDDIARRIRTAFDTRGADVDGDVRTTLAQLKAGGLVSASRYRSAPIARRHAGSDARSCSVANVASTLARVRFLLRTRGLLAAAGFAFRTDVTAAGSISEAAVKQVVERVNRVATLAPFRAECLERSLAVARSLRRLGADAKVRLAIRHFPFEAHAWAELDGRPVNEADTVCALYEPFPALDQETLACLR